MHHSSNESRLSSACRRVEILYVAESERDAEALSCQTEERVILRSQRVDSDVQESEAPEALSHPKRSDASDALLVRL
jgi:hypothetical protein